MGRSHGCASCSNENRAASSPQKTLTRGTGRLTADSRIIFFGGCMNCFSYDAHVIHSWFALTFPGVFFPSRVAGASPVTTDLTMRGNVRTTTTTTTTATTTGRVETKGARPSGLLSAHDGVAPGGSFADGSNVNVQCCHFPFCRWWCGQCTDLPSIPAKRKIRSTTGLCRVYGDIVMSCMW